MSPELSALIASVGKSMSKGGRGGRELKRTDWSCNRLNILESWPGHFLAVRLGASHLSCRVQ